MNRTISLASPGLVPPEVYAKREMLKKLAAPRTIDPVIHGIQRASVTQEQDNEIQAAIPAAEWLQEHLKSKTVLLLSGVAGGGNKRVKHEAIRDVLGCWVEWPDLWKMKRQADYTPWLQRAHVVMINPQGMSHTGFDYALQYCRKENKPCVVLHQGYGLTQMTAAMYEHLSKREENKVAQATARPVTSGDVHRLVGAINGGKVDHRKTSDRKTLQQQITASRWKNPDWLAKQAESGNSISAAAKRRLDEMQLATEVMNLAVNEKPVTMNDYLDACGVAMATEPVLHDVPPTVRVGENVHTVDSAIEPIGEALKAQEDVVVDTPPVATVLTSDAPPEILALVPLKDRLLKDAEAMSSHMRDAQRLLDMRTTEMQRWLDEQIEAIHENFNTEVKMAQDRFHERCSTHISDKKAIENRVASIELALSAWEVKGE